MNAIVEGILMIVAISVFVIVLGYIMDSVKEKDPWK